MSNRTQDIVEHYSALPLVLNLPALTHCTLKAERVCRLSAQGAAGANTTVNTCSEYHFEMTATGQLALGEQLERFQPVEGWLCFQSEVKKVERGELPQFDEDTGWLLYGELINQAKESLHIWQDGDACCLTRFTEGEGEEPYLVQEAELLSVDSDQKTDRCLNYRVYWKHDAAFGFQRYCSRFTGFSTQQRRRR